MKNKSLINGADYFLYAMDKNIQEQGLACNLSIVLLEFVSALDVEHIQKVITLLFSNIPVLSAKYKNTLNYRFYWSYDSNSVSIPKVEIYNTDNENPDEIINVLMNKTIDRENGKLIKFDIINCKSRYYLCITFDHVFMDAQSIRQFIDLFIEVSKTNNVPVNDIPVFRVPKTEKSIIEKLKLMRASLKVLDNCSAEPRSISLATYKKTNQDKKNTNSYKIRNISFDTDTTKIIDKISHDSSGFLNDSFYYLLILLKAINSLYERLGLDPGSFVFPISMQLAKSTDMNQCRGNNITFLYYKILKEDLAKGDDQVISSLKKQFMNQIKHETNVGAYLALETLKYMTLNAYRKKMYQSMKGEIGTFIFSNLGDFKFKNTEILNNEVLNIQYYSSMNQPPGIGFIFSRYKDLLNCSIVYVDTILNENEVDNLIDDINKGLKNERD